jgi:hypothetical protein
VKDSELQKLMDRTHDACVKHNELLRKLEKEYEKRFGTDPSSVDDDYFIDTFHYGQGGRITVSQMTESAKIRCK